ncbi:MAG: histidine kinase [Firmicutes bacterium]|nr:histidine kinase [Bacillota bacterium]
MEMTLEAVLDKTVNVLDESKKDIFEIAESSRKEYENIENDLLIIKGDLKEVIDKVDRLERINRKARLKLMEVSRDFHHYTEGDIKAAYEKAEETSVEIAVLKEKEEQLKIRRQELENRLINLKKTVNRAENLVSRVSLVREFLKGELTNLSEHFDELKQKHNLAIKVIQAQEDERGRVSREIHDGPAQSIANLVFRVELTQKLMDKDLNKAKKELKDLKKSIRLSMQEVRRIIYNLRPMSLDDLGLIPTLNRYIDRYIDQTGIIINFNVSGTEKRLPKSYEVTIFRLIQEGLNNIHKHSNASSGRVRLDYANNEINLLVSDDGVGFESDEIEEEKYGLMSMEERCKLLGGSLSLESEKSQGTTIKINLPIKKE